MSLAEREYRSQFYLQENRQPPVSDLRNIEVIEVIKLISKIKIQGVEYSLKLLPPLNKVIL